jgi:HEAT repeat protein
MRRSFLLTTIASLALGGLTVPAGAATPAAPFSDAQPMLEDIGKLALDNRLTEADRLQLIAALGKWGTAQVRAPLIELLKDPSASIRGAAANALGWQGNREAIAALRERVDATDETAQVRALAVEAIGRIADESTRDALLALTREPTPGVRQAALTAVTFGPLGRPADRRQLLRRIAEDRTIDPQLRSEAVIGIGVLKDTEATDLVTRLLEHEPPVRMPAPIDNPTQQQVMLIRYWQARDVRAWAAKTLGQLDARPALPLILKAAEDPQDFFLRATSLETLVEWNVPEARPVLLRRLDDAFADNRILALEGVAKTADASLVPVVVPRLDDSAPKVRAQAARTLGELGDRRARVALEALRGKELEAEVQQEVEAALERLPK